MDIEDYAQSDVQTPGIVVDDAEEDTRPLRELGVDVVWGLGLENEENEDDIDSLSESGGNAVKSNSSRYTKYAISDLLTGSSVC